MTAWALLPVGLVIILPILLSSIWRSRRDRAEEALRESEQRFRNMSDHAPMVIWVTEADGAASYLNRRWTDLTGQEPGEALGHGWLDCVHDEDRDRTIAVFGDANKRGVEYRYEYRLRRKEGGFGWVISAGAPRFSPGNVFLGHVGTVFDITERKIAEMSQERLTAELKTERRLLHAIIDYLPTGVTVTAAATGNSLLHNAEAKRLLSRPPEPGGNVRHTYADLGAIHADGTPYRSDEYPTVRALLHGEAVQGKEMLYRRNLEGPVTVLSVNSAPVGDSDGKPWLVVTTFHDITERKAMEETLRATGERLLRSERHLTQAQALARTGSWELEIGSGNILWSAGMYLIFGQPETFKPSTESVLALIDEDTRDLLLPMLAEVTAGGTPDGIEINITRPDGTRRICWCEAEPQVSDRGEIVGVVGMLQDVTEARIEEARRHELERQLLQVQKMEALGTLASGIAHDLNNALVPVLAMTEALLREQPEDSADREDLQMVVEGAARARDLVRQILAFSRQEVPNRRTIDIGEVVRSVQEMMRRILPVTIDLRYRPVLGMTVLADPSQIHQVVVNLVTNAAQAIGNVSGAITITLDRDAGFIRLGVEDTGPGMDEAILVRVFEPFFTTKPVGEGTGLGFGHRPWHRERAWRHDRCSEPSRRRLGLRGFPACLRRFLHRRKSRPRGIVWLDPCSER